MVVSHENLNAFLKTKQSIHASFLYPYPKSYMDIDGYVDGEPINFEIKTWSHDLPHINIRNLGGQPFVVRNITFSPPVVRDRSPGARLIKAGEKAEIPLSLVDRPTADYLIFDADLDTDASNAGKVIIKVIITNLAEDKGVPLIEPDPDVVVSESLAQVSPKKTVVVSVPPEMQNPPLVGPKTVLHAITPAHEKPIAEALSERNKDKEQGLAQRESEDSEGDIFQDILLKESDIEEEIVVFNQNALSSEPILHYEEPRKGTIEKDKIQPPLKRPKEVQSIHQKESFAEEPALLPEASSNETPGKDAITVEQPGKLAKRPQTKKAPVSLARKILKPLPSLEKDKSPTADEAEVKQPIALIANGKPLPLAKKEIKRLPSRLKKRNRQPQERKRSVDRNWSNSDWLATLIARTVTILPIVILIGIVGNFVHYFFIESNEFSREAIENDIDVYMKVIEKYEDIRKKSLGDGISNTLDEIMVDPELGRMNVQIQTLVRKRLYWSIYLHNIQYLDVVKINEAEMQIAIKVKIYEEAYCYSDENREITSYNTRSSGSVVAYTLIKRDNNWFISDTSREIEVLKEVEKAGY